MAVRAVDPITPIPVEGDIEVIGRLVVDRVSEIVELRESLAECRAAIAELSAEVDQWRGRALSEAAMRRMDAERAHRGERELVTVIHRQLVEIDGMTAELDWRRQSWWRRARRKPPLTAAAAPAPAPR